MPRKIPIPLLQAGVGMYAPYIDGLTVSRLEELLEHCAHGDQPAPLPESLTKADVMSAGRLSLSTVNRLLKSGELPFRKVGSRSVRIPRSAVEELLSIASMN